jgi:hypothetical protein
MGLKIRIEISRLWYMVLKNKYGARDEVMRGGESRGVSGT